VLLLGLLVVLLLGLLAVLQLGLLVALPLSVCAGDAAGSWVAEGQPKGRRFRRALRLRGVLLLELHVQLCGALVLELLVALLLAVSAVDELGEPRARNCCSCLELPQVLQQS